ncbi:MAG: hydrogenase iron-sulfur subunit [Deltaproteobacteria bacterium]|nr:MAG: hydrogenase iron-sulfur subunit [Deltaproteobacteria bacterium]
MSTCHDERFCRLERWEKQLDACIRCGYCYEHCPIYMSTGWESDTPRGKLVLAHAMLHGLVEPDEHLADKIFQCFHCRRCEKACSSGVKLLDILRDARADLLDAGFSPTGTVSQTDHERCVRCLNCARTCPHLARSFDGLHVVADPIGCVGCGGCLDACSAEAIRIEKDFGTAPDGIEARLARAFEEPSKPELVVFCCSYSNRPGLLHTVGQREAGRILYLTTACAGRLAAGTVLMAFELGAKGVMIATCAEGECDHAGSERAARRTEGLRAVLQKLGIAPGRLLLERVGFAGAAATERAARDMLDGLQASGSGMEG